ncbi:spermine/spermidine synthase [Xylariaceae sp. FL1019]|nr:spermine/spermidine synthase [Xylariaceae sp. FL1019]
MAPKKPASKKKAAQSVQLPHPSETKEGFENELRSLARQAQQETWSRNFVAQASIYAKAAALIILAAAYANVSVLTLSPVYGQIAASRLHDWVVLIGLFTGWGGNVALRQMLPFKPIALLPLMAIYVPAIQHLLFKLSSFVPIEYGPAVTEALTLYPMTVVSTACIADILEEADLSWIPKSVASSLPGISSFALFKYSETALFRRLFDQIGVGLLQTRMGLQLGLAAIYTIMGRSRMLRYAIPGVLHAAFYNPHLMTNSATASLNATLNANGWSLVDRWESNTGYISVLESYRDGFRVMRCDHSLLGGEWTRLGRKIVAEPVYSVFTQLEAIRLVQVPGKAPDHKAHALNIGLGIGTTPSALIAHGIDTTIVEIDPVVYNFAIKYFGLPSNHTAVVEDVVSWSQLNGPALQGHYDYIVHDVFTGGAEPVELFTGAFLQRLNQMLSQAGVIVINYAGDFTLAPLSIVVHTVKHIFPSCRVFRENEAPSAEKLAETGRDFDNVMIFCTKVEGQVIFRQPIENDYLQSITRKQQLVPRYEVPDSAFLAREEVAALQTNGTERLAIWHAQSALRHWDIMRTVIPHQVWEQW